VLMSFKKLSEMITRIGKQGLIDELGRSGGAFDVEQNNSRFPLIR
jgi:hypothetical protein